MKIGNTKKGYGDTKRVHAENLTIPQTTATEASPKNSKLRSSQPVFQ